MGEPEAQRAKPYPKRWWLLLATSLGLFMIVLDSTVVNVSIPSVIRDLGAPLASVEWVVNAYTIVFASLMITFGRLGDMYGRRRMFILGSIIFGVGSLASREPRPCSRSHSGSSSSASVSASFWRR